MIRLFAVLAAVTLCFTGCSSQKAAPPAGPPPAVPVSVAPAVRESVPIEVRAVGNVEPFATVQVKSQIAGELLRAGFTEGSNISKGALLFEIDSRPYLEALRQAQAALSRDNAQLQQAEANLARDRAQAKNADAEAARTEQLFQRGIAAKNLYEQVGTAADVAHASVHADEAAIESARATLESDRAAIERAKLDLGYCEIRSSVSGRAGNLLIQPGNLIKANDVPLVVINQIEPVFVSFGMPEHNLAQLQSASAAGRKLGVDVTFPNVAAKTVRGYLTVIDNTVDPTTGTIKLKAIFDNKERLLWPGQFVNAVLRLEQSEEVIIPAEAIQAGQQGQFVYVVKPDHTVDLRPVVAGAQIGNRTIIEKGVAAGDTIVTDGQLRLFPGARISEVPAGKIDSQKL